MKIDINKFFDQYELLDCGQGQKLERFNDHILIRPEINAQEPPALSQSEWSAKADATFIQEAKTSGKWISHKKSLDQWLIEYNQLKIELKFTKFKHLGIFPEQSINWDWISKQRSRFNHSPKFLNLFGYTGVASLVANQAGFEVTHIDSIKQVVNWGKSNMQLSDQAGIKWIVEDVSKFVAREIRRKNKYDAIILDPPAKGRGPKGELWRMEENLEELLAQITQILNHKCFVILNLYSHNINIKFLHKLILTYFKDFKIDFCDQVFGQAKSGKSFSHGFFIRISR